MLSFKKRGLNLMMHSFQADIFSNEKPIQYFIEEEIPKILAMNNYDLVVIYQIIPPGMRVDDYSLPIYISFSSEGKIVDSDRALKFNERLVNQFKYRLALCPGYLSEVGVDMDKYFVTINYVITNKNYFNAFISGSIENKLDCVESRMILELAYAEVLIGENRTKILKSNPSFKIPSFELNTMSKIQFLEYCINHYGFERFMKIKVRGSIGKMNIVELYI